MVCMNKLFSKNGGAMKEEAARMLSKACICR